MNIIKRMKTMKKAQAQNVFLYIVTIVVVGLVLLFGYSALTKLIDTGERASSVQLQNNLQDAVDRSSSFGRVSTQKFVLPEEVVKVCLISTDGFCDATTICPNGPHGLETESILVSDTVAGNDKSEAEKGNVENIFLIKNDGLVEGFVTDPISLGGDTFLCEEVNRNIHLRFEGKGRTTDIKICTEDVAGTVTC